MSTHKVTLPTPSNVTNEVIFNLLEKLLHLESTKR